MPANRRRPPDAKEVDTKTGKAQLVQLRNPWGHKEWTGDWSDKSDKWTMDLKLQLDYSDEDDGIFWMTVQDFCNHYASVYANHLQEDYVYTSQKVDFSQVKQKLILFEVNEDNTHAYITIQQKDQRNYVNEPVNYKYGLITLIVADEQFTQFKGDKYTMLRECFFESTFKKGRYLAYVETTQDFPDARDFIISAYASSEISFLYKEIIDPVQVAKYLDIMVRIKPPEQKSVKVYDQDPKLQRKQVDVGSYICFVYTNQTPATTVQETVTMTSLQCLQICPPHNKNEVFEVNLGPQQEQVVKYKILPLKNGSYGYGLSASTKLSKKH